MTGRTNGLQSSDTFGDEFMDVIAVSIFFSIFLWSVSCWTNIVLLVSINFLQTVPA